MSDVTRLIQATKALEKATNGRLDFDSAYEAVLKAAIDFDEKAQSFGAGNVREIEIPEIEA